ncbi:hypothetical protein [Loktanella sp. M215]|uniref:hypothetical protein n=1 Tax=Loktanella sp. M215 TaxID=2675431 RepID=UPI001F483C92|nr:hypothetical protein [Loktanella sp. M215]MCF7700534.1 hypothetical protein [Loktanella sp. M215]
MIGVILPCLARAVLLAREGQSVIYLVPSVDARREAWGVSKALGDDVGVASEKFGILSVATGSLQILTTVRGDLSDCVRGRAGLIVLHAGLRWHDWRAAANAMNAHRYGVALAERANGHAPVSNLAEAFTTTCELDVNREDHS